MRIFDYVDWDDEDHPTGNVAHIAEHGVTPEEVEDLLDSPESRPGISDSSRRPTLQGYTSSGRFLFVVYEIEVDSQTGIIVVRPVTAYTPEGQ